MAKSNETLVNRALNSNDVTLCWFGIILRKLVVLSSVYSDLLRGGKLLAKCFARW